MLVAPPGSSGTPLEPVLRNAACHEDVIEDVAWLSGDTGPGDALLAVSPHAMQAFPSRMLGQVIVIRQVFLATGKW